MNTYLMYSYVDSVVQGGFSIKVAIFQHLMIQFVIFAIFAGIKHYIHTFICTVKVEGFSYVDLF